MNTYMTGPAKTLTIREQDAELARKSSDTIMHFVGSNEEPLRLRLEDQQTGAEVEATVPRVIVHLIVEALAHMAGGKSVSLILQEAEISTQQAAELLGVSRPYFVKLLEQGGIPYRKVGEQRRVHYNDLLAYRQAYQHKATAALDEMTAEAQKMNLYE